MIFGFQKRRDEFKKRNKQTDDNDAPKKKRKSDDNTGDTEVEKKKDKKSKSKVDDEVKVTDRVNEVSEESDAIETDIHEDSDEALKPEDKALIDFSDCSKSKDWKKRIAALQTSIKCRLKRIERIDQKLLKIEESGLTAKNKKFHTAMHQDKLCVEERKKILEDALKTAQEQLKKIDPKYAKKMMKAERRKLQAELKKSFKKDKGEGIDKEKVKEIIQKRKEKKTAKVEENSGTEIKESPKKHKEKKSKVKKSEEVKEVVDKSKDIKVVESLEPALEVPSAKEFWSDNADNLAKNAKEDTSSSSEDEVSFTLEK